MDECLFCDEKYYYKTYYGGMFSTETWYNKIEAKFCPMCGEEKPPPRKPTVEDYSKSYKISWKDIMESNNE